MSKAFYIADKLLYRSSNLDGHAATVHQLYTIGSAERDFLPHNVVKRAICYN